MVNVASLMKNAKQEEQNKDTPSVTEQNKAIAPAPVEQNDIPSIPNVPADAKATTATSDGTVDIGTDKVKDASADVTATPVDYKYDKATGKYTLNPGMVRGYWTSDEPEVDTYDLLADMIEAGDADSAADFMKIGTKIDELNDLLNLKGYYSSAEAASAIKNLTPKMRNAVASMLRRNAAIIKSSSTYTPAGKTNESPVKPIAPVADKAKPAV